MTRTNFLRGPMTTLLVVALLISCGGRAETDSAATGDSFVGPEAGTSTLDASTDPARAQDVGNGGVMDGSNLIFVNEASNPPIHDAAASPDALIVPDPAPVACGSPASADAARADAAEDASGVAEADGSGQDAEACDFPPSVCADADWLVFFQIQPASMAIAIGRSSSSRVPGHRA